MKGGGSHDGHMSMDDHSNADEQDDMGVDGSMQMKEAPGGGHSHD